MAAHKLGVYDLLEEIGRGGMATVYRAYHPPTDRLVAIKVLQHGFAGDPEVMARFQREARLVARLEHPHLLPVYDFDGEHEPPYIVMRYVRTGTLKQLLSRGRLPPQGAAQVIAQVASALDYAHRQGVVHRDIKPSNIMVDEEGNAFLGDFGLARLARPPGAAGLTLPGTVLGTPGYMAPEQAVGAGDLDQRADIYSLGVVLFELLTGELPYKGDTPVSVAMAHVNEPIPRATGLDPGLPAAVDQVLAAAMAKDPKDRTPSAGEFARGATEALGADSAGGPLRLATPALESIDTLLREREERDDVARRGLERPRSGRSSGSRPDSGITPSEQTKQVTALFVNVAELAEWFVAEDPQGAKDRLEAFWTRLEGVVAEWGGSVEARTHDSMLALWGAVISREDDPERAVAAALAIRDATRDQAWGEGAVPMQAAVTTGPVLLTPRELPGCYAATGTAISLVRRLERTAPPGGIVLGHDAYRHVRGVVEVAPFDSIRLRERRDSLRTYLVQQIKPKPFRLASRGIEGVETRMVGRTDELAILRHAFQEATAGQGVRAVTVLGAPGMGKSRLLYEFTQWVELEPREVWLFRTRATREMAQRPYSLLRMLLAVRFDVQAPDGPAEVCAKLERGVADLMATGEPEAVGETVRFLSELMGAAAQEPSRGPSTRSEGRQFRERVTRTMGSLLRHACNRHPVLMELADLHWADEPSLDVLNDLLARNADLPLLLVALARPELLERRPAWDEAWPGRQRIDLAPLTRQECGALVDEILQKVEEVPSELRKLVVDRAEGNPYYVEELLKVLLEEEVVLKGEQRWRIDLSRLRGLDVPATLTGLMQVRLDMLQPDERIVLQRASVVGRHFWEGAVQALEEADGITADAITALRAVASKGLIHERETSVFEGTREFLFASNMFRDVVAGSIPSRQKRGYHAGVARWLETAAGARFAEFASVAAEHFDLAGVPGEASRCYALAGDQAVHVSAYGDAAGFWKRALELSPEGPDGAPQRARLELRLGEALWHLGGHAEARLHFEGALAGSVTEANRPLQARALFGLAQVALSLGEVESAQRRFEQSLEAAEVEDRASQGQALLGLGEVAWRRGDYGDALGHLEASLMLAREAGDQAQELAVLSRLGSLSHSSGDFQEARRRLEECRAVSIELGSRDRLAEALNGLGEVLRHQGDVDGAAALFEEALALARATGLHGEGLQALLNLGFVRVERGAYMEAEDLLREALRLARASQEAQPQLRAVVGFAWLKAAGGEGPAAAELLAVALTHPSSDALVREYAGAVLAAAGLRREDIPETSAPLPSVVAACLGEPEEMG